MFGDVPDALAEESRDFVFVELLARLRTAHDQQVHMLQQEIQRALAGARMDDKRQTTRKGASQDQDYDLPGFAREAPPAPQIDPTKMAWKSEREATLGVDSATSVIPAPPDKASSEAAAANCAPMAPNPDAHPEVPVAERTRVSSNLVKISTASSLKRGASADSNAQPRSTLPFIRQRHSIVFKGEHRSVWTFFEDLIARPWFDSFFCALIFINSLVMGMESQYRGVLMGASLKHDAVDASFNEQTFWVGANTAFQVIEQIFGVLFLAEALAKMLAQRRQFPLHVWNWIDTSLVCLWIAGVIGGEVLPIRPSTFRLLRLARLMRLVRLAHTIQGFDSLYLISTSLSSSVTILGWTTIMFFLLQLAVALLINQVLAEFYFQDGTNTEAHRREVFTYFGTFSRSLFSMFEVTLANYSPVWRSLGENVSEVFMLFGVLHKLTVGFAFVGVINGVFMQETFKVAATDDRIMIKDKTRMLSTHVKKMRQFFQMADSSGDGEIDKDEFLTMTSNEDVRMWLSSMGLDVKDSDSIFALIDDGDGQLTLDELIAGVARLKGAARSIDVVKLAKEVNEIKNFVQRRHDPDNLY